MQSGIRRKHFKVPNQGVTDVRGRHITGIGVDALNRTVVVSTLKGLIHVRLPFPFFSPSFPPD
jgi:U3 small nucleolar RNA-associated protein 21